MVAGVGMTLVPYSTDSLFPSQPILAVSTSVRSASGQPGVYASIASGMPVAAVLARIMAVAFA